MGWIFPLNLLKLETPSEAYPKVYLMAILDPAKLTISFNLLPVVASYLWSECKVSSPLSCRDISFAQAHNLGKFCVSQEGLSSFIHMPVYRSAMDLLSWA